MLSRRFVGALASMVLFGLMAGFAWFVHDATLSAAVPAHADGIVVLTGGAERITTGARLLQRERGRVMLISGVGHGAELATLLRGAGVDTAALASRITLGRSATSTAGNADETASWVASEGLHSLFVVTASYHMPRAMTELQRSLPGVALFAVPVIPPAFRAGSLSSWRLLAHEYAKWLVSKLGLARLRADPVREPG